ncbi:hypothetical protein C8R43DRAFT_1122954 [Mycena crocata]|nr:hypothetical protein C8R43DRAFT_1122954 [Mycena crocata]
MDPTESMTENLVASAILLRNVKYMNVVSITILVFDYLLCLNLEVSLVWRSKWSFNKLFFLCARYPPFIDVPIVMWYSLAPIDPNKCLPIYTVACWMTFFGIAMAEALLLLRTYALMGCRTRVLITLLTQYIAIVIITIVVVALFLKSLKFGAPVLPSVTGCHMVDGSIILVVAFILVLLNETVLMILTLWSKHSIAMASHILYSYFVTQTAPSPAAYYSDGAFVVISFANLAVLIWGPVELVDLFTTFLRVMHSVLSTRIVLHVRAASKRELDGDMTTRTSFADPIFRIPGTTIDCHFD